MPTEPEHLAQFHHNVTVAERLFESNDWDWGVTALFYASLHLVQAYFVREGIPARTHMLRDQRMRDNPDLAPVASLYKLLRDYSENARYECRRFSRQEAEHIRNTRFEAVSSHVRALLGVTNV